MSGCWFTGPLAVIMRDDYSTWCIQLTLCLGFPLISSAMEVMKKAHREELERELEKARRLGSGGTDRQSLSTQQRSVATQLSHSTHCPFENPLSFLVYLTPVTFLTTPPPTHTLIHNLSLSHTHTTFKGFSQQSGLSNTISIPSCGQICHFTSLS